MRENVFHFKQFAVRQQDAAMKIGTDGVLLGAWARFDGAPVILDIGTGTGVLALMAAQREPMARVDAVEIDVAACVEAAYNFEHSPWSSRLRVHQGSILDYRPSVLYRSIVCNPPFFVNSTPNPLENRTTARHCTALTHQSLLQSVAALLSDDGNFSVILPVHEAQCMRESAKEVGLFASRMTRVLPTPQKPAKRMLMEFVRRHAECAEDELTVELERHKYSEEYYRLTSDFYLYKDR